MVAAIGFAACGLVLFFIDLFRLPSELLPDFPLDPSQIIGTAMILAGAGLYMRARRSIKRESGNEAPQCHLRTCCRKGQRHHSVRKEYRATRGAEPALEVVIPMLDLDDEGDSQFEDGSSHLCRRC